ncbi:MAG TPA: 16S rRNA (cytosine(1402)-N(4))-methyltransferase, partial [Chlorobaculum parvum]|nr:16S rRNA (cytosine(1402)-N(4))-methyltransferase [Chlorobaculum parvum]
GPKGLPLREPLKPAEAELVIRKSVQAGEEEVARNPRARSARLRVIQKLET